MERDERTGKTSIRKVGMAPVQRDRVEYEFDVFLDMDVDNNAIVSKTRCPALTGRVFSKPGADIAKILGDWLTGDNAPQPPAKPKPQPQAQNGNGHHAEDASYADVEVVVDMAGIPEDTAGHLATPQPVQASVYASLYNNPDVTFTYGTSKFVQHMRKLNADSSKQMSAKQYGFMCSLVDDVAGADMHGCVLSAILG